MFTIYFRAFIEKRESFLLIGLTAFFSNLDDDNKGKILNQFLNKRINREDASCNSMFHKSVQQLLGLSGSSKSSLDGEDNTLLIVFCIT